MFLSLLRYLFQDTRHGHQKTNYVQVHDDEDPADHHTPNEQYSYTAYARPIGTRYKCYHCKLLLGPPLSAAGNIHLYREEEQELIFSSSS